MRLRILYAASPEWRAVGERIDEFLIGAQFTPLKQNSRTLAGFIQVGERAAFMKRVESRGYVGGLFRRVLGSKAVQTLRGAKILDDGGFNHPRPLVAIEHRAAGSMRASYIVMEALQKPQIPSEVAIGRRRDKAVRKSAARAVAAEIRRLHDAGIYTLDMQETNLMIEKNADGFALYFVDLEDFRRTARVSMRRRMTNLAHLDRSIGRFASRAHRLRFLYYYLDRRPSRIEARELLGDYLLVRASLERSSRLRRGKARPGAQPISPDSAAIKLDAGNS